MIHLSHEELLHVAGRALGHPPDVRDHGLLASAAARPRATAFGEDAYRDVHEKAAALLHSLARNHPLVDGNKRLALAATIAFYGMNGYRLALTNDEAYALVMRVADGTLDDVPPIAAALRAGVVARRRRTRGGSATPCAYAARPFPTAATRRSTASSQPSSSLAVGPIS